MCRGIFICAYYFIYSNPLLHFVSYKLQVFFFNQFYHLPPELIEIRRGNDAQSCQTLEADWLLCQRFLALRCRLVNLWRQRLCLRLLDGQTTPFWRTWSDRNSRGSLFDSQLSGLSCDSPLWKFDSKLEAHTAESVY